MQPCTSYIIILIAIALLTDAFTWCYYAHSIFNSASACQDDFSDDNMLADD